MAAKLDIKSIEFRNFLSYGDYVTEIDVSDSGPTLVTGDNGAGKTSFLTALVWCIFGRTEQSASPGDRVVNWETGSGCYVKVTTKDGWVITRTRAVDNHNDLLVYKDGDDTTKSTNKKAQAFLLEKFELDYEIFTNSVFCGQSGKSFLEMAPIKRKEAIERLLGLDKINEYAKISKEKCSQVESEQNGVRAALDVLEANLKRQETRIGSMDDEIQQWDRKQEVTIVKLEDEIENLVPAIDGASPPDLDKLQKQWDLYKTLKLKIAEYENKVTDNGGRIRSRKSDIEDLQDGIDHPQIFKVPDLSLLEEEHQKADQAEAAETERTRKHARLDAQRQALTKEAFQLRTKIAEWDSRSDSTCTLCEQKIGSEHIHAQTDALQKKLGEVQAEIKRLKSELDDCSDPIVVRRPSMSLQQAERLYEANSRREQEAQRSKDKIAQYENEISELETATEKLRKTIKKARGALESAKPKETLRDAREEVRGYEKMVDQLAHARTMLDRAKQEVNPYIKVLKDLKDQFVESSKEVEDHKSQIDQLDLLYSHWRYIYRSYSDRRKIKSLILSELIPYLNDRIAHYLATFEIDMTIKFSSTLTNETDKWDYEFCSGGERKKIDLSIMFAIYDLYMSLYGQQCNIMVFDEVDSKLDAQGVQTFSEIVTSYFGDSNPMKPDSIYVISHKPELKDLFPSQIVVKKENGFSVIGQN